MRRTVVIVVAAAFCLALAGHAAAAPSARIAALQVALRSHGLYSGAVDGVNGPLTRSALLTFQRNHRVRATGKLGMATRCKLGRLGTPLLGQRVLSRGRVGWDVTSLEFRLRPYGLAAKRVDGRFDAATAAALRRFQRAHGLGADGIAGTRTFRALAHPKPRTVEQKARPSIRVHRVQPGEGFDADCPALRDRCGGAREGQRPDARQRNPARPAPACPGQIVPGASAPRHKAARRARLSHGAAGRGLHRDRAAVRDQCGPARAGERAHARQRDLARSEAARAGPARRVAEDVAAAAAGADAQPDAELPQGRRGRELLLDRAALPREPVAARAGEPPPSDVDDRPRAAADASAAARISRRQGRPSTGTRSASRSTGGPPPTPSTRSSRGRSRGWNPGSRRTSSRAPARWA